MTEVIEEGPSFRIERSAVGATLVATERWTAEAADALRSGRADGLDLNYAKGFKNTDLAFMEDWPLKRVSLLARTVKELGPLYRVASTLESLSVESGPAVIDLGSFPHITDLAASWEQISDSVSKAHHLESLYAGSYTAEDLTPLQHNSRLKRIRMKDRPRLRSLRGVEQLPALDHLGIYLATSLHDFAPLRETTTLRELHLESCRSLNDLTPIAASLGLRLLNVAECGDIVSLAPIAALLELEAVLLYGTTKIVDDDLTPLAGLPRLRELRMRSRRSYRPSVEQLHALIEGRV